MSVQLKWQCGLAVTAGTVRVCRQVLGLSQSAFAAELGVSPETYRVWDSGRRAAPAQVFDQAQALVAYRNLSTHERFRAYCEGPAA